eukprot:7841035-Ditylum_brightwellii.AAC.1
MFCVQNRHLRDTIGISVKGFSSLDLMIQVPGYNNCMSLHQWFLTFKTTYKEHSSLPQSTSTQIMYSIFAQTRYTRKRLSNGSMSCQIAYALHSHLISNAKFEKTMTKTLSRAIMRQPLLSIPLTQSEVLTNS